MNKAPFSSRDLAMVLSCFNRTFNIQNSSFATVSLDLEENKKRKEEKKREERREKREEKKKKRKKEEEQCQHTVKEGHSRK